MTFYRLTDRAFSRIWRRNKDYTEKQLMLLARHSGSTLDKTKAGIQVKRRGKLVANFAAVNVAEDLGVASPMEGRKRLYAALRNPHRNRTVMHSVRSAMAVAPVAGDSRSVQI